MDANVLTENDVSQTDAAAILADFARRGIRYVVYRRRGGVDIVWRPFSKLTDTDRAALRDRWDGPNGVRAFVLADFEQSESASPETPDQRGCLITGERRPALAPLSPSKSETAPAVRTSNPDKEPTDADRRALGNWRVEIRPGQPPRPLPPPDVNQFVELLRRSREREWQ